MLRSLTLPEITELTQGVLDSNRNEAGSLRTSGALSARTVRWYATAGVLDPPGRDGHSAVYGRRHLLQLLYTRQEQGKGRGLAGIKEETRGLTNEELTKRLQFDPSEAASGLKEVVSRKAGGFWERQAEPGRDAIGETSETASSTTEKILVNTATRGVGGESGDLRRGLSLEMGRVTVLLDESASGHEIERVVAEMRAFNQRLGVISKELQGERMGMLSDQ